MTETTRRWAAAILVTAGLSLAAMGLFGTSPEPDSGDAVAAGATDATLDGATADTAPPAAPDTAVDPATTAVRPAMGDPDAPLTIVEYSDYLCPFCGRFSTEVEPALVERYVDAGLVRIEWHDFPVQGDRSVQAAIAARAAGRQDAYWAYHDALFALQGDIGYVREEFVAIAGELGLDTDRFARDLDDPALETAVRADLAVGQQLGVRGTPSFLIGGVPVVGAQPLSVFVDVIDAQLAERGITPEA